MTAIKIIAIFVLLFLILRGIAFLTREDESIDDENPYLGNAAKDIRRNAYEVFFKPFLKQFRKDNCKGVRYKKLDVFMWLFAKSSGISLG